MTNTPKPQANTLDEIELGTKELVEVSLYMYAQWEEAMKPPLFIYKSFPDWLAQLKEKL